MKKIIYATIVATFMTAISAIATAATAATMSNTPSVTDNSCVKECHNSCIQQKSVSYDKCLIDCIQGCAGTGMSNTAHYLNR